MRPDRAWMLALAVPIACSACCALGFEPWCTVLLRSDAALCQAPEASYVPAKGRAATTNPIHRKTPAAPTTKSLSTPQQRDRD